MLGNMAGITEIIISIFLLVLLVIGLWYSKMHSFKAGVYFFLLLIIHEIYSFISPPLIQNYIENLITENNEPLLGNTIGEFTALLSLIPQMILLAAFLCLIVGLRGLWGSKNKAAK